MEDEPVAELAEAYGLDTRAEFDSDAAQAGLVTSEDAEMAKIGRDVQNLQKLILRVPRVRLRPPS